jgi:hypothetical protein
MVLKYEHPWEELLRTICIPTLNLLTRRPQREIDTHEIYLRA